MCQNVVGFILCWGLKDFIVTLYVQQEENMWYYLILRKIFIFFFGGGRWALPSIQDDQSFVAGGSDTKEVIGMTKTCYSRFFLNGS